MNELLQSNGFTSKWSLSKKLTNGSVGQVLTANSSGEPYWKTPEISLSSNYIPSATNGVNVDLNSGFTRNQCIYTRVGDVVTVSGEFSITPTTDATLTTVNLSLPIASDFTAEIEASGIITAGTITEVGSIRADVASNTVIISFLAATDADHVMTFQFSYVVL